MDAGGLLCVLLFFKLCEIGNLKLTSQFCSLDSHSVGKCVPAAFCPQVTNLTQSSSDSIKRNCDSGSVCCRVSAKIVTPTNTNSVPAAPTSGSSTSSPEWVSVTPTVVNPTSSQQPNGGAATGGSGGSGQGGSPSNGNRPPTGSGGSPAGGSAGGSPAGGAPVSGGTGGSPPAGGAPSGSVPPNGSSPPSGNPPPLMGSIVAGPEMPSKSLPPVPPSQPPSDTIVVSAEVIDNTIDMFDKKCELYHSGIQPSSIISSNSQSPTPTVMIFGGTNSQEKEFPHMAALGFGDPIAKQWLCGGSLITENYVVTAAHCLSAAPLGEVRYIKLGNTRLDRDTQNTQLFNVVGRVPHPQYDIQSQYNDIALVQMDGSVRITEYVMPICLFSSTNYEDKNLIATGWGKTESGTVSLDLKKVGLELFSQSECQNAYSAVPKRQLPLGIQELTQVCAGSRTQNKDTCQGDSGGPLQLRKNNRWYLIGITSVGIQCGNVNSPGVYTRLAYFLQWIQQNVWNK